MAEVKLDKKPDSKADKKAEKAAKKASDAKDKSKAASKKAAKSSAKKPNAFKRLIKYLSACKGELKKITWPTPQQTTKNFGIVIAVIVIMGLFLFALDQGLYALLGLVMDTAKV